MFWVKQLCDRLSNDETTTKKFAISDVRFLHEVKELREQFGNRVCVIKIVRPGNKATDTHVSETEWLYIKEDILIENDGSLEDLYAKVDNYLQSF